MKILNLSWDSTALDKNSNFFSRILEYVELVDKYCLLVPTEKNAGLEISERMVIIGIGGNISSFYARLKFLSKLYKEAAKILSSEKYDVISVQDPFELAYVGRKLAKKFKVGFHIQEHGDFFSNTFWRNENVVNFCRYYLGKSLLKKADSIRTVSHRIKNTLITRLKIDENIITSVPIYIDISEQAKYEPLVSLKEEFNNKFVFFTAGRLVKQKNLELLINALKIVTVNIPNVVLLVAGQGREKNNLIKLAKKNKLEDKVLFFDWLDDGIYEWYKACDAYVLSSNYEGWGRVIIEAASCGLPIVMTDVGCAGEVIKDGQSGVIVPIGNVKKMAEAMLKIIKEGGFSHTISLGARQAVTTLPTKEETLKLYKRSWEIALK